MFFKKFSSPNKLSLTYWLKTIDNLLGSQLTKICSHSSLEKSSQIHKPPKNILIIRPGGIGDAILLLPALSLFKKHFPSCKIFILAEKRNVGIFESIPYIKEIFLYHKIKDLYKTLKYPYDIVIDTEQWHYLSAILAFFTKAPIKIGFATNKRAKLFNYTIPYSHDDYEIFSFLRLLEPIMGKINWDVTKAFFPLPSKFRFKLDNKKSWIAIFPGASISERKWPKERFREIALWLHKNGIKIVIVGGKQDIKTADYIIDGISGHLNMAGKTSLKETAQILSQVKLLLTTDSGIMHLSIAVGTPVVALFGPGIEKKWAPRDGKSIVINKHLPCSPCTKFGYTPPCPYNARCMREINVDEVKGAINAILDKVNTS